MAVFIERPAEPLLNKGNKDDIYFCCSSAFRLPELKMISEPAVDAALSRPAIAANRLCVP